MSGSEMQREKEKVAQKMREKQAAGESFRAECALVFLLTPFSADAKKAAEAAGGAKKK